MTSVSETGPGDYIKVANGVWKEVSTNTAFSDRKARRWIVTTTDGRSYGMYDIYAYMTAREYRHSRVDEKLDTDPPDS